MTSSCRAFRFFRAGLTLVGACALAGASPAAETVLLTDTFNAATGNTHDLNVDLARQTGLTAPVSYTMAGGPGHYGHQLQNANAVNQLLLADFPNSTVSLNLNFNGVQSAGGLRISFDIDPVPNVYGGDPGNWGCINLGLSAANQLANVNQGVPHFGVLFRRTGTLQAFDGGANVTPVEPTYTALPAGSYNHIDIILTDSDGNPFDGSGDTVITIYANGGASPVYTYTKTGGFADNYFNLQGSFRAHFDNLEITRRDGLVTPVVANPSFEVDTFNDFPGYANQPGNGPITGWSPAVSGLGLNGAMPAGSAFADNGVVPDGTKVCFIQNAGANIRQTVGPFTIGGSYVVRYSENARNCCGGTPSAEVRVGGNVVVAAHAVTPVGGANPYTRVTSGAFVATANSMELVFTKGDAVAGDSALILDAISVEVAPTLITQQPRSACALPGQTVTLTVSAIGPGTLTYQWRKNGVDIPGATSATLTLNNVTTSDTGGYSVVVTSSAGSVASSTAKVVVGQIVPSVYGTGTDNDGALLAAGSVDPHYRLHASADPAFPGPNVIVLSEGFPIPPWLANGPASKWIAPNNFSGSAQPGDYTYRLTFDLNNYDPANTILCGEWATDNTGVNIFINGVATGNTANGFGSFSTFLIDSGFVAGQNTLDFVVNNGAPAGPTGLRVNATGISLPNAGIAPTISRQPQDALGIVGSSVSFTVVGAGSMPLSYQWYHGAAVIPGANSASLTVNVTGAAEQGLYSVEVSNAHGSETSRQATLTVRQRVPGLFNTGVDNSGLALADGSVDSHYALVVNADGPSPDAIVQDSAAFPIVTGPWLPNNAGCKWIGPRFNTGGAAGQASGGGLYVYTLSFDLTGLDANTAVITGGWATDNSGLDIRVNGTGTGFTSPDFVALSSFTLNSGNATFLPGVNTLEFVVRNDDAVSGYTGLRVENLIGFVTLPSTPPSITSQPQNRTAGTGESVSFSVSASGSSPLSYQWRKGGIDIMGATASTYTINNVQHSDAGSYDVVVSNPFGSATSAAATLVVRDSVPGIYNTGVDDLRVVLADGAVDSHYKLVLNPDSPSTDAIVENSGIFPIVAGPWVPNDSISKWIGPRLDTGGAAAGDYTYRLTVDLTGFDTSSIEISGEWSTDNAGLDILVNGVSSGQQNNTQFTVYSPFTLTTGFTAGPNTIDFKVNNAGPTPGPTGLRIRGIRGLGTLLPPGTAPFIVVEPVDALGNYGDVATFRVVANGSLPLAYQWYFEGSPIPGATGPSHSFLVDFPDVAGAYSVEVSNGAGMTNSRMAVLTINEPPVVPQKSAVTSVNTPMTFPPEKLLQGVVDPEGDSVAFDSVAPVSAQGGSVSLDGGLYTYTPPAGFTGTDSISFTVRDSRGGVGIGILNALVVSGTVPSQNQVLLLPTANGYLVRFAGIPGREYIIQRSTNLSDWTAITGPLMIPPHGLLEFEDVTALPAAFYRTVAAP